MRVVGSQGRAPGTQVSLPHMAAASTHVVLRLDTFEYHDQSCLVLENLPENLTKFRFPAHVVKQSLTRHMKGEETDFTVTGGLRQYTPDKAMRRMKCTAVRTMSCKPNAASGNLLMKRLFGPLR